MLISIVCFAGYCFLASLTIAAKSLFWLLFYAAATAGAGLVTLSNLSDVIDFYDCGISILLAKLLRIVTFLVAIFTAIMFLYNLFN